MSRLSTNCGTRALRSRFAEAGAPTGCIVTDSGGYILRVPDDDVDLRVFADQARQGRRMAARGDLPGAVTQLRRALALWRGTAFTGVTGRLIESAAIQLDEQRRNLYEECLSHELALGRGAELVDEIAELAAARPFGERVQGHLMLALSCAGRRTEALEVYHRVRRLLIHEMGIEPGPELSELHRAVLNGDPGLGPVAVARPAAPTRPVRAPVRTTAAAEPPGPPTATPPVPAQLPAQPIAFTGRDPQLDELTGLLDAAVGSGRTTVAVLSGTAGVGKTALAIHFARLVADRFPDGQLYVDLRGFHPTSPRLDPDEAIRGFLGAFGVPPAQIPGGLAAASALLRTILAGRRVLLLLDNARDADDVRPLLPGAPQCLTLITSRSRMTGLVATDGAHPIILHPLPPDDAHRLLTRRLGTARVTAEPAAVASIAIRAAGLPLALAIVTSRAAGHPTFPLQAIADELEQARGSLDGFSDLDTATDVRSVLSWSYHALSDPAARLFRLLSLHPGPELGTAAAASLAGVPPQRARSLLTELAHTHMVTERTPGRYGMHDLLRAYATERASTEEPESERLAATRRMLDHYLSGAYLADLQLNAHRDPIHPPARAESVTVPEIGDRGAAWAWFSREHPGLLNLLRQAGYDGHPVHAWQLGWALTTYLDRRGHWHDQVVVQQIALQAARRVQDPDGQARAHRNISIAQLRQGLHDDAQAHLRHALRLYTALDDPVGQARTLLNLGTVAERRDRPRLALRYAEQALNLFRTAEHRPGQANALNNVGWYHSQLGNHEEALHYCQQALPLQQETGNRYWEAHTWDSIGNAHHQLSQFPQAAKCYQEALSLWREAGERYYEATTLTHLAATEFASGETGAARNKRRQALEILTELGHPDAEQVRSTMQEPT
ncbi:BTAD domain-containing putative transcriptional regulator [Polymorphospora sp. NPDC051019]|uniref:AfsR/SARP family transcriptional regulator n=1 Tax=Polymorphospora sp. NPDC051019 TaxID=3155725 RepID=UPI00341AB1F9